MEVKSFFLALFIISIALGFVSQFITSLTNYPELNVLLAIAVYYPAYRYVKSEFKEEKNLVYYAVLLWYVTWTVLYNLAIF